MIEIKRSETADTRSCDYSEVSRVQLMRSSLQHIDDVRLGLEFIVEKIRRAELVHDGDKITDISGFHRDFVKGFSEGNTEWWDNHRKVNRHHLMNADGVPDDVNLVDVLDMIVDCVMAGIGRTGEVYPLNITSEILQDAFQNTVEMVKKEVVVI